MRLIIAVITITLASMAGAYTFQDQVGSNAHSGYTVLLSSADAGKNTTTKKDKVDPTETDTFKCECEDPDGKKRSKTCKKGQQCSCTNGKPSCR